MNAKKEKLNTVRLQNISYGHRQSAVLRAAIELGLFTAVSEGASTFSRIAGALGISELNAERLVVACASTGLMQKSGDGYANASDVERFLVKGKQSYIGPWLL
ncbi:MAG: methyltransferase dimerization domain-containing protein, partial [Desulfobacterales bacterium]